MSRMKWWWTLATMRLLIWKFFAVAIFGSTGQATALWAGYAAIGSITVALFWPEVTLTRCVKWCLLMIVNYYFFSFGLREVDRYVAINFQGIFFIYSNLRMIAFLLLTGGISFWIFVKDTNLRAWPAARSTPDSFDCTFIHFTIDRTNQTFHIDAKNGRKGDARFGFRTQIAGALQRLRVTAQKIMHESSVGVYDSKHVGIRILGSTIVNIVERAYIGSLDTSTYSNWDYLHIWVNRNSPDEPIKVKLPKVYSDAFIKWFDTNVQKSKK